MHTHERSPQSSRPLVAGLIVLGTLFPLIAYAWSLAGARSVTAWRARRQLSVGDGLEPAVLIDVRSAADFEAGHIEGAINWPVEAILAHDSGTFLPGALQNRTLFLIDNVGVDSAPAARHLRRTGDCDARQVRGGIQEWIRSITGPEDKLFAQWRTGNGSVSQLAFREPRRDHQIVSVAAFFVVKPLYTMLSLLALIVLWRSTSADLVALWWGMLFFLVGENACAVNVLVFKETSYLLEYLHSAGMVICLGFVTYAILEGVDRRILGFSAVEQRCGAIGLCGRCIKHADVPCGLRRLFTMVVPLCMVLALMLPVADWHDTAYNTLVFGQFYHYGHLRVFQLLENWVCPALALMFLGVALATLLRGTDSSLRLAKITFSAGVGALVFGALRVVIGGIYSQTRVWHGFWEETTELVLMVAICFTLWTFRAQLIPTWERRRQRWVRQLTASLGAE